MQITLKPFTAQRLKEAAHYCNLPQEKLVELFVEDGLALFHDEPDNFKESVQRPD